MTFKYAYMLPIAICIWFPLTIVITYILAVYNKDVFPVFPYISDTGNWSPESCFFGLMLNIGALLMGVTIYIRYRQIRQMSEKYQFAPNILTYNRICLIIGILATFGVFIVACFQETSILIIHLFGAGLAFNLATIYEIIQTYISYKIYPSFGSKITLIFRSFCTIISCIALLITVIFGMVALLKFSGNDITKWKKSDYGFIDHFISAIAEWILVFFVMIYFATFTNDFKAVVSISEPIITIEI